LAVLPSPSPVPSLVLFYDELFLGHRSPGHPESPERLRAITAYLRADHRLAQVSWATAPPADEDDILLVHSPRHLARIQALSAKGGGWIDGDTYCERDS
jgi:acetoin utilization deacetylase AcuC-like enzyme